MVVILKDGTSESNIVDIVEYLDAYNVSVSVTKGEHTTILGLVGDTTSVDQDAVLSFPFVEDVEKGSRSLTRQQTRNSIRSLQ